MRALVTGGTGLIGRKLLARVPEPVVVSRDPVQARRRLGPVQVVRWEPEAGPAPLEALRGVEAVFHLAGEPVAAGRWTVERKQRIRDSRVLGTRHLVEGMAALERKPEVLVSVSAVGYYGDRGDEELDENSSPGGGFLAEVCQAWEREALGAEKLGVRVVCARIGLVLARGGGALARMLPPFRMGVGGRLGSGKQWMSWIHLDDVAGLLLHAAWNREIRGAMNVVSPHPVTNIQFTRALGRALHRPAFMAVPGGALRVAFGEMSEVLTGSQRVFPRVAQRTGYAFQHPDLEAALQAVLAGPPRREAA